MYENETEVFVLVDGKLYSATVANTADGVEVKTSGEALTSRPAGLKAVTLDALIQRHGLTTVGSIYPAQQSAAASKYAQQSATSAKVAQPKAVAQRTTTRA